MEIRDPSRQRTVEARHQKGLLGPSEHVEEGSWFQVEGIP